MTRPSLQLPQNPGSALPDRRVDEQRGDSGLGSRATGSSENPTLFALRTSAAALVALAVAYSFDVPHPWWAAMTVWLVAQPTRGLLLERSLARLAGTACGALAGALILSGLEDRLLLSIVAFVMARAVCGPWQHVPAFPQLRLRAGGLHGGDRRAVQLGRWHI